MTVGVTMMRNEEDVAPFVVRHMLEECDVVIVADNRSTDGTRAALEEIAATADDLLLVDEPRFAYYQAETMMRLAGLAQDMGAEWVVPFDADEWWFSTYDRPIREVLAAMAGPAFVAVAQSNDMAPGPDDDPEQPNPFLRITRLRNPGEQKVAFRPGPGRVLQMGNHGLESGGYEVTGLLRIHHFPYRSLEQARQKLRHGRAALEATDYSAGIGWHWRDYGALSDEEFAAWWRDWCR